MNASGMPTTGDRPITTASAPVDLDAGPMDHLQRRVGRGRDEALVAEAQQAGVQRMDAVDVLERVDGVDDGPQPDARGKRHLDDDPVDLRVVVEPLDRRGELALLLRGGPALDVDERALDARPARRP